MVPELLHAIPGIFQAPDFRQASVPHTKDKDLVNLLHAFTGGGLANEWTHLSS
jgi:hypothetical protein